MESAKTPYEEYLKQSITLEKARLDSLYNEFAKSNPIRKQLLRAKIEEATQNIDLLSRDLDKYMNGLSWLREPSHERDEKAEHLPKLEKEAAAPLPAATAAKPGQAAKPVVARPTIGKPVGSAPGGPSPSISTAGVAPRPIVGTPVGTRPKIGTPVGTPTQTSAQSQAPPQANQKPVVPVSRPIVGTPVKRPVIGTPIGKPKPSENDQSSENASS